MSENIEYNHPHDRKRVQFTYIAPFEYTCIDEAGPPQPQASMCCRKSLRGLN